MGNLILKFLPSLNLVFFMIKLQLIQKEEMINDGDNAWLLMCSCLTMFMTPGLAFFYGGMVDKKNLLSTIAYCLLTFGVASLTWALLGFSLAFGDETGAKGFIGNCVYCGLRNIMQDNGGTYYAPTVPFMSFFIFQTMLAATSPALFVGTIVGRIKMSFILIFTVCFNLIIYAPVAYWEWNVEGWLHKMGSIDFSGGNVVHIPAGFAALAAAIYTGHGEQKSYKQNSASISLTLIGTGILWFGWFGYTAGSAISAGKSASLALTNTHLAACAGGVGWAVLQYFFTKQPSIVGWCCGAICGLTAITPAAGYVHLWASLPIGFFGGILSYIFCHVKAIYFDELADTLDVFGCHGIAAIWGGIATGAFASRDSGEDVEGLFYGNARQFGVNVLGVLVASAYAFFMTLLLFFLIGLVINPKVSPQQEQEGLDVAVHGQENQPLTEKEMMKMLQSENIWNYISKRSIEANNVSLQVINGTSNGRIETSNDRPCIETQNRINADPPL